MCDGEPVTVADFGVVTTPRLLALAAALAVLGVLSLLRSAAAGAQSAKFISPVTNHIEVTLAPPDRDSATLPTEVMRWLERQGLPYVIPRVPSGYPPVKAGAAVRVAATHTSVGSRPHVLGVALISPLSSLGPVRAHQIYWAIALRRHDARPNAYYVSFVESDAPVVLGSLRQR